MAVHPDVVYDMFMVFLGRAPDPTLADRLDSFDHLIRVVTQSGEFRNHRNSWKSDIEWPLRQVFVAPSAKVMYCPIGKNACSYMKSQMVRIGDVRHRQSVLRSIHFFTDHANTGVQLSDYPREDVDRWLGDREFFKFAILRDPRERLLSAYIEKFVAGRLEGGNIGHTRTVIIPVQRDGGLEVPDYQRGISFQDFVNFVVTHPPHVLDAHWRPQETYLSGIEYDRFYRLDQINDITEELKRRSGVDLPLKAINVTGSGRGGHHDGAHALLPAQLETLGRLDIASFYTPELDEKVRSYFAGDYALLEGIR